MSRSLFELKKLSKPFITCLLLGILVPASPIFGKASHVYRTAKSATALIVSVNEKTHSISLGSGFFLGSDGLLVSSAHVLEKDSRILVYVDNRYVYTTPEIVGVNWNLDLAAFRIRGLAVSALPLAHNIPEEGTEVLAVGYPRLPDILQMGLTLHTTVVPGTISSIAFGPSRNGTERTVYIQTTGVVNSGNSGGPLVDLDTGEVAGMVVHTVPYLERVEDHHGKPMGNVMLRSGITYSIPAETIRNWLASEGLVLDDTTKVRTEHVEQKAVDPLILESEQSFVTGLLVQTIANQLDYDSDLLNLAIGHYKSAVSLHPQAHWVYPNLGYAYAALHNWEKARDTYLTATRFYPHDADLLTETGYAWQQAGNHEQAVQAYQAALKLNDCFEPALTRLGTLLSESSQLDKAIVQFRHALKCNPNSSKVAYHLGISLRKKGLEKEALEVWNPLQHENEPESFAEKGLRTSWGQRIENLRFVTPFPRQSISDLKHGHS